MPLGANLGLSLLHNFTDIVSTAGGVRPAGRLVIRCPLVLDRPGGSAGLFSREQNLAVVGLVALAAPFRGRLRTGVSRRRRAGASGAAGCVCCVWEYGYWPFITDSGQFEMPFAGMWYRWSHLGGNDGFSRRLAIIHAASMIHLLFLLGVAFVLAWRQRNRVLALAMLGGVALAVLAGHNIYMDFWSYNRVFVWVPLGIWLGGLQTGQTWSLCCLAPGFLWSGVAALNYV